MGGKGSIKAQLYGDKPTRHKTVICLHYQCLCCLDDLSDSEVNRSLLLCTNRSMPLWVANLYNSCMNMYSFLMYLYQYQS